MKICRIALGLSLLGALGLPGAAGQDGALPTEESRPNATTLVEATPDWVVSASDNICGLKKARQLSNPGRVDFDSLYDSTPEAQKIVRDGIDPSSPEGQQLKSEAYERIRKACEQVMGDRGLCSVWKKIEGKNGRQPTDVTEDVRLLL